VQQILDPVGLTTFITALPVVANSMGKVGGDQRIVALSAYLSLAGIVVKSSNFSLRHDPAGTDGAVLTHQTIRFLCAVASFSGIMCVTLWKAEKVFAVALGK